MATERLLLVLLALPGVACSLAGESLFSSGAVGAGGAGGASSSSAGIDSAVTSSSAGETATDASAGNGATTTASSSSSVATASSSSGGPQKLLPCDAVTCDGSTGEACCWDRYGVYGEPRGACVSGPAATDNCVTMGDGYGPETRIECATPDQCGAGQVCCAQRDLYQQGNQSGYVYSRVSCEAACQYPGFLICTPGVTQCPVLNTNQGPVQLVCKSSALLPPNYTVCGFPN